VLEATGGETISEVAIEFRAGKTRLSYLFEILKIERSEVPTIETVNVKISKPYGGVFNGLPCFGVFISKKDDARV